MAAVRSDRAVRRSSPAAAAPLFTSQIARIAYDDADSLRAAFASVSTVIHLAGILVERPGSTYEQANVETTRNMVEAAKQSGVTKIVLVSANFADVNSPNRYWRTKGQAEALVRASGVTFTILRAPLLLGPETEGSAQALLRNAARSMGGAPRRRPHAAAAAAR